jgi:hypothetical protein
MIRVSDHKKEVNKVKTYKTVPFGMSSTAGS